MKNPLAWLAGAVVLYLATRPKGPAECKPWQVPAIDGHCVAAPSLKPDERARMAIFTAVLPGQESCPDDGLGPGIFRWGPDQECVRREDLTEAEWLAYWQLAIAS